MPSSFEEDREIREFRDLMKPPDEFREGFGWQTVVGAIFVGVFMMPAAMYLQLLAGSGIGPAARWVTVIIFLEVAKRSFTSPTQQQIFILFSMAGMALGTPFSGFLWNQYLVQSEAARMLGLTEQIPHWVAPPATSAALVHRTFFHRDWLLPIGLMMLHQVIGRIDHFGLSYVLFRISSDVERLPFPMAPVGAMGVLALAETTGTQKQTWRWRMFSTGAMIGVVWGAFYVGLPAITSALFPRPITLFPIPWADFTRETGEVLPAVAMPLSFNLGVFITGMVLPFWAVVGSFLGLVITVVLNPTLYRLGVLHSWKPDMGAVDTLYWNNIDFYMSFGIGIALAVAVVGFYHVFQSVKKARGRTTTRGSLFKPPRGRGDFSIWIAIGIYLFSTSSYILICRWLAPTFPWYFLVGYGFVYVPLISYVTARLEGIAGQYVSVPFVKEAGIITAYKFLGYSGIGIWFAPIPLHNYGMGVVRFRQIELTGTSIRSVIKSEFVVMPIILIAGLFFSQFLWRLAPIPSNAYPYTQEIWDLRARGQLLWVTSTMEGDSVFWQALIFNWISWGLGAGLIMYILLATFGLPIFLIYGVVRGLGQDVPGNHIPELLGALVGRFYFQKRYGKMWRPHVIVLLAGFSCGTGLAGMIASGIALISKAVQQTAY